jgi:hypothetical protein
MCGGCFGDRGACSDVKVNVGTASRTSSARIVPLPMSHTEREPAMGFPARTAICFRANGIDRLEPVAASIGAWLPLPWHLPREPRHTGRWLDALATSYLPALCLCFVMQQEAQSCRSEPLIEEAPGR